MTAAGAALVVVRLAFRPAVRVRSDPHMPEAFISRTTSPGPGVGVGSAKVIISRVRSPVNTTPFMLLSREFNQCIVVVPYAKAPSW